jgi:hypothetical protein
MHTMSDRSRDVFGYRASDDSRTLGIAHPLGYSIGLDDLTVTRHRVLQVDFASQIASVGLDPVNFESDAVDCLSLLRKPNLSGMALWKVDPSGLQVVVTGGVEGVSDSNTTAMFDQIISAGALPQSTTFWRPADGDLESPLVSRARALCENGCLVEDSPGMFQATHLGMSKLTVSVGLRLDSNPFSAPKGPWSAEWSRYQCLRDLQIHGWVCALTFSLFAPPPRHVSSLKATHSRHDRSGEG